MINYANLTPEDILFIKGEMRNDMHYFGRTCFPELYYAKTPQFHKEIYENLMDYTQKKLLFVTFRGSAKTTIIGTIFVLYDILLHNLEGEFSVIAIVSKTQDHAKSIIRSIKHALNKPIIKKLFGDWSEKTFEENNKEQIVLKDNTCIKAFGTGQQIRGFNHLNVRPTLILVDDPEDKESTKTEERRKSTRDWFGGDLEPAIADDGRIIVLGNYVHPQCLINHLRESGSYKTFVYSVYDENGNPTWPERFPESKIKKIKEDYIRRGELALYYMEYENKVVVTENQPFKVEKIKRYEIKTIEYDNVNKVWWVNDIPMNVFIGIDPAKSISEQADKTAILVLGITADKDRYVLDYFNGRLRLTELIDKILEYALRWNPLSVNVESILFQELIADILLEKLVDKDVFIPINKVNVGTKSKESKLKEGLTAIVDWGKLYIRDDMKELEEQMLLFPNAKHDDLLDALYLANYKAYGCDPNIIKPSKTIDDWEYQYMVKKIDRDLKHKMWMVY